MMGLFSFLFGRGQAPRPQAQNIQMVNPAELLYSLATLCEELPPLDPTAAATPQAVNMHEDNWRQIEFVDAGNRAPLEEKMAEYIAFSNAHRKGAGFTGIYLRKETYPSLLPLAIKASSPGTQWSPLAIAGQGVCGGFALADSSGACLYGLADSGGTVIYLGLEPPLNAPLGEAFKKVIFSLISGHQILLVDWYKGEIFEQVTPEALRQWEQAYLRID